MSGNFMVFRTAFMKEQKEMEGEKFARAESEKLCSSKWGKMGP
jgi:hypothetical protein